MASRGAPEDAPRVAAIVLAAGRGSRMGGPVPKYRVALEGRPMVVHVIEALRASRAARVLCVLRPGDAEGRALCEAVGAEVVWAEAPDEGRAASVRAGVRAAGRGVDLLFALADQPFLRAADFDALIGGLARSPGGIVHAAYAGERGSPVLFSSHYRDELLELRGSEGGRELIRRHPAAAVGVELDSAAGRDVDRPHDM